MSSIPQPFTQQVLQAPRLRPFPKPQSLTRLPLLMLLSPLPFPPRRLSKLVLWRKKKSQPKRQPLSQQNFHLHPKIPPRRREPLRARNQYWSPFPSLARRIQRARVQPKQLCLRQLPKQLQRPILLLRPNRTLAIFCGCSVFFFFFNICTSFYVYLLFVFLSIYFFCLFKALMKSIKFLYFSLCLDKTKHYFFLDQRFTDISITYSLFLIKIYLYS